MYRQDVIDETENNRKNRKTNSVFLLSTFELSKEIWTLFCSLVREQLWFTPTRWFRSDNFTDTGTSIDTWRAFMQCREREQGSLRSHYLPSFFRQHRLMALLKVRAASGIYLACSHDSLRKMLNEFETEEGKTEKSQLHFIAQKVHNKNRVYEHDVVLRRHTK